MVVFPARPMVPSSAWRLLMSGQCVCRFYPSMIATIRQPRDVSCRLSREHASWSSRLFQLCVSGCLGRIQGLPYSRPGDECLPLRSSNRHLEDQGGRGLPIGFLLSVSPVLGFFLSYQHATQGIASLVLLLYAQMETGGEMTGSNPSSRACSRAESSNI
jgi:hypothetical protein